MRGVPTADDSLVESTPSPDADGTSLFALGISTALSGDALRHVLVGRSPSSRSSVPVSARRARRARMGVRRERVGTFRSTSVSLTASG